MQIWIQQEAQYNEGMNQRESEYQEWIQWKERKQRNAQLANSLNQKSLAENNLENGFGDIKNGQDAIDGKGRGRGRGRG